MSLVAGHVDVITPCSSYEEDWLDGDHFLCSKWLKAGQGWPAFSTFLRPCWFWRHVLSHRAVVETQWVGGQQFQVTLDKGKILIGWRKRWGAALIVVGIVWYMPGSMEWYQIAVETAMGSFLEKLKEKAGATTKGAKFADAEFRKSYPCLSEFLTVTKLGDEDRETGTLTFSWEAGLFKVGVNDRENEQSAFVSSPTFLGALQRIEEGFGTDDIDWRRWKAQQGKGRGGKGR